MSSLTPRPHALTYETHPFPAAVLELGALVGALFAGYFADKYSRRYSIIFACSKLYNLSSPIPNELTKSNLQSYSPSALPSRLLLRTSSTSSWGEQLAESESEHLACCPLSTWPRSAHQKSEARF